MRDTLTWDETQPSPCEEATAPYAEAIQGALSPTFLAVTDVTDGHAEEGFKDGRALRADGREILILVVAPAFEGMPLLDRQRAVNSALEAALAV